MDSLSTSRVTVDLYLSIKLPAIHYREKIVYYIFFTHRYPSAAACAGRACPHRVTGHATEATLATQRPL